MSQRTTLLVFGGLLVQYAAVGLFGGHGEPWPVLVLPAFQSTWDADGELELERVRLQAVMADGSARAFALGDLFASLPATHHPALARAHFECAEAALSPALARWTRRRLETLFPGGRPVRLVVAWEIVAVSLETGVRGTRAAPGETCEFGLAAMPPEAAQPGDGAHP